MNRVRVNKHFRPFLEDWEHYFYVVVGGYGSSKSYNTAIKLISKAISEPNRRILVVREVYETIRESCYNLLLEVCSRLGLKEGLHFKKRQSPLQITFFNGSEFIFKGCDNSQKLKSINGVSIIWVEECTEVNYESIKELIGRLRHNVQSNHIIYTSNPVSKNSWLYRHFFIDVNPDNQERLVKLDDRELYEKRIIKRGNAFYHHSVCDDNYFLPSSYIEQLDDMQNYDRDLWRIARRGEFGVNGKKVLPQIKLLKPDVMLCKMEEIKTPLYFNGLDFGFVTSYNALLRMVVDHDNKDLFIYWEYYSKDKTDEEIARDIEEFRQTGELIKADSAEPKAIRYYKQKGFNIKACKKFKGSRNVYTKKVKRFRNIFISTSCPNAIKELCDLSFAVNRDGQLLEDEFNIDAHTLSAIWYGLDNYEVASLKVSKFKVGGVSF
ncbi:PBSX family phage terminase large subunit [Gemella sp. zg-570]|uniref:PBSX family phage terminase large subunit n=1 Tax=Gemella sp. zg-570 TaxID=2840371 RepID=UPI001C0D79CF|nr:PBSX family phage terminase large subunit [Gemella sp. zg-570]QWQ39278.1 PBSX family phage terminase large subunit [Gemella sp. zg-570]